MRRFTLVAALAAAGLAMSCGIVGERPQGYEKRDYSVDPSLRYMPVPLSEIVRNPQFGAAVEFEAMLNRRDESVWQAYYTPFKPGEYKSFSVWPADAAVWDVRGRGRSIPTLYIEGDSPEVAELYEMKQYAPVRIRGIVASAFDSRPWIKVNYVDEIGDPWFNDESLGHLIRGLDAARTNGAKAMSLLDNALDGPLSPAGMAAAWKAKGWIHLGRKEFTEAESAYMSALDCMHDDRMAADGLERARLKAAAGPWTDETSSKDDPPATVNWKDMYSTLFTEHEGRCKTLAEEHARCAEMAMKLTSDRDAAVKAHADCAAGAEGVKKQLEEKDAATKAAADKATALEAELKTANEKVTALEAERDELKKKVEGGGADAEASKKALEEKDAAIKAANDKVTALEAERDELKKKAEAAGGGDEALKKEVESAKGKVTELEQQVKDRDETIKKQRDEIDKLTEELKKKEGGN